MLPSRLLMGGSYALTVEVVEGDVIGTVQETEVVVQKIMVPPGVNGELTSITGGDYTVEEEAYANSLKWMTETKLS